MLSETGYPLCFESADNGFSWYGINGARSLNQLFGRSFADDVRTPRAKLTKC